MGTGRPPFPWYGGKSRAAALVWERLGNPSNFVDPFCGALSVLLQRPHPPGIETVNDKDGFVCNVFRALQTDPDAVAAWADWPVSECDLHARHLWLVQRREALTARLMGDPAYYDPQVAGWWLWGIACWIGGGWCRGQGPWTSVGGQLVHLGNGGQGVHRRRVHLGGQGGGVGVHAMSVRDGLRAWFTALAARIRHVRVCCGDWMRVLGPSVTFHHGLTGILLDPPYSAEDGRDPTLYACEDLTVAHAVRAWCLEHGQHPLLRIALCGYGEGHDALLERGWTKAVWTANGGYGNQRKRGDVNINKYQERIWFSPACVPPGQLTLF